jgi:IS5 family transposase
VGYETLVREVSDSLHLRRFCLIALRQRVPDESTVRKLTRRLGGGVVDELTRLVIVKAVRETRFRAGAVRIDSTVVQADVRYPTDSGLSLDGARVLVRESRRVIVKVGASVGRVVDRTRTLGRRLRLISRTLARRTGERKAEVLRLTEQARATVVALDPRSTPTGSDGSPPCARSRCAGEARSDRAARGDDRPRAARRDTDQTAPRRRVDRRPARLDVRPPTRGRSARASSASPTSSAM